MLYEVYVMHAYSRVRDPLEEYARVCMETKILIMIGCLTPRIYVDDWSPM